MPSRDTLQFPPYEVLVLSLNSWVQQLKMSCAAGTTGESDASTVVWRTETGKGRPGNTAICRPISVLALQSGSFSRRRNCLIHGSLVNSKTEIIGRLIMLGAWYIAKVIRHLGRLNHCVNAFGKLTLDFTQALFWYMQCLPSSQRKNDQLIVGCS